MADINIGVNLIEILTTGMYKDARTIYREYVQNSCDALDKIGGGKIEITIDADKGYICIEDDGCGISAADFKETLKNIAQSEKSSAVDKGFRGIGKLCGLAYCDKLIFTATAQGENISNSMHFDATNLQKNFYVGSKISAYDRLSNVTKFSKSDANINAHGFKVELFGVTNSVLLDAEKIIKYLAEVAPVPYSDEFSFADKIHAHAEDLGCQTDEYKISVNGKQIFKNYKNIISSRGFRDELFDVSFMNFYDAKNNLLAWSWIGLTSFVGQIKSDIPARAIRLRKGNIQIGDQATLQNFFKELRGNYYFVGEIFGVHKNLIPNSQRDYFVPNDTRNAFETALENYFLELHKIYHAASDINSGKKKIREYKDALDKFPTDEENPENILRAKFNLISAGDKAKQAHSDIKQKISQACENPSDDLARVVFHLTENVAEITIPKNRITPPISREESILGEIYSQVDASAYTKKDLAAKIVNAIYRATDNDRARIKILEKILEALK